ncbi:hypothetical protein ILUMI_03192 [Ignelater luminosus]|uniref:HTH psq-type domain-containing protein n=1 Tax=Ignelater luminosus TaxID=2038154 RepID=A0A8K0DBF3_IGNLU|nr:hypothetical protein ILUMI_03192 [Ignelater luminosus]
MEQGLDLDYVTKVWQENHFPNDDKLKCYFKCLNLKFGVMDEQGNVIDDTLKQVSSHFHDAATDTEIMGRRTEGKKRIKAAANKVIGLKKSLREVAKSYGISMTTLGKHIKKHKLSGQTEFKYEANNATQKLGVTVNEIKKLDFQYAKAKNVKYPAKWNEDESAGRQWYRTFRLTYRNRISLIKSKTASLGQMACFNKPNVEVILKKLAEIYLRHPLQPQNVWNLNDTGQPPLPEN